MSNDSAGTRQTKPAPDHQKLAEKPALSVVPVTPPSRPVTAPAENTGTGNNE